MKVRDLVEQGLIDFDIKIATEIMDFDTTTKTISVSIEIKNAEIADIGHSSNTIILEAIER